MCALLLLLTVVPATAGATRYLSRASAVSITKAAMDKQWVGSLDRQRVTCYPAFRAHTKRNLRRLWRLWDCSWRARVSEDSGRVAACSLKVRVTGQRGGSTWRSLRDPTCKIISTPTPAPAPAPVPAPAPAPTTRAQQMIEQALRHGIQRAQQAIDAGGYGTGLFYYGKMHPEECVFLNATRVRCPLYMWWEQQDQDANFYTYITRDIFKAFVFVEDLGTSVGFNSSVEPQSLLTFDTRQPYYKICGVYYGAAPCPAERIPIAYPPIGYPRP